MDTTINRRQKKKESEDVSEMRSGGNTGSSIKRSDESIPIEILHMSDDDPRLTNFMEEAEEERRRRHPNQTHEELKKNVDAILESRKKKHP